MRMEFKKKVLHGQTQRVGFHNKKKNGDEYWVSVSILRIKDENGILNNILEVQEDITQDKALKDQLVQAQKMEAIGTLAGGVAHDFNNLLSVIIGYSEHLLNSLDKKDQRYKIIESIGKAGHQGASLTDQLLSFSRKQVFKMKILNLNIAVLETEKMLGYLIGEDIELLTDTEPELWLVEADKGQINQILMNLSVNARDAMAEGGKIVIRTENVHIEKEYSQKLSYARPGRFVCLSIEDTGTGMDQEILSHIFDPFFTTKGVGKGTGLGLPVIYGIVKQHDGWVNVYSEPGQGSVFKVYLPASFTSEVEDTEGEAFIEKLQGNGERILLVEDEELLCEFIEQTLSENGYTVFKAKKAAEALDLYEREKGAFHIVFSDVVLPDINGIELVNRLLAKRPELKVLLSSGYLDDKSQWSVICERGFNFLMKPYSITELLTSMKEALK